MSTLVLVLSPRALRDLKRVPRDQAATILQDTEVLQSLPWPGPPRLKWIKGTRYARLRSGDYRSIVVREGQRVIVLRVVARKDFERALKSL